METLQVKKLNDSAIIPTKGSPKAAGYDLCSIEEYILMPMDKKLFKTGLSFSIPNGMYGRIAPRSGLAFKDGIDVLAGVIDEDYRGEIGVILINFGKTEKKFNIGDKIAQIIFEFCNDVNIQLVTDLTDTVRGQGGFGSTDNVKSISVGQSNTIIISKEAADTQVTEKPIKFKPLPGIKPVEHEKTYESKVDLIDQWKKAGGTQENPSYNYEKLIKEREKQLGTSK